MAIVFTKGEIVDIDLGQPPNEIKGHEQGMQRPCLVVKSLHQLGLLVILPITGTEAKYSLYTIVKISTGEGGLTKDSYALFHQIRTISIDRVKKRRGIVSERTFNKVTSVLLDTLGL